MRNLFTGKKWIVTFFILGLISTFAFCERWSERGTECTITLYNWERPPIVIVNNTSQYVRIAGNPGAIKPHSSGSIDTRQVTLQVNSSVEFLGDSNSTTVYVNSLNNSGGSGSSGGVDVHCITCHGSGKCPKCNGRKTLPSGRNQVRCDRCNGSGVCPYCHGTGRK